MKKISILSQNDAFKEDLSSQIQKIFPDIEISFDLSVLDSELYLIDDNENLLNQIIQKDKSLRIVFFSSTKEVIENADLVIKKPFSLVNFLKSMEENTLLPKVRRKECINFIEYSLYPVKKEITSSKTGDTIKLTEKEVEILKYLYANSPSIISKEELLENVWGYCSDMTTHTIETHIYRLRQKVEQNNGTQIIITENNGYRLNI